MVYCHTQSHKYQRPILFYFTLASNKNISKYFKERLKCLDSGMQMQEIQDHSPI